MDRQICFRDTYILWHTCVHCGISTNRNFQCYLLWLNQISQVREINQAEQISLLEVILVIINLKIYVD